MIEQKISNINNLKNSVRKEFPELLKSGIDSIEKYQQHIMTNGVPFKEGREPADSWVRNIAEKEFIQILKEKSPAPEKLLEECMVSSRHANTVADAARQEFDKQLQKANADKQSAEAEKEQCNTLLRSAEAAKQQFESLLKAAELKIPMLTKIDLCNGNKLGIYSEEYNNKGTLKLSPQLQALYDKGVEKCDDTPAHAMYACVYKNLPLVQDLVGCVYDGITCDCQE